MSHEEILNLDPIVHAPIRLAILSILVTAEEAGFSYLKDKVHATDGNLSVHLTKLETSGYIDVKKRFVGKKPQTSYSISNKGKDAFLKHLRQLEEIVKTQKSG